MKTCGVCLNEFPTMWKAKTKTEPQKCKSCALKNATQIGNYKITNKSVSSDIKKLGKKKRKSIAPISANRQQALKRYRRLRDKYFEEHPVCEFPDCTSQNITLHHMRGRIGAFLTDKRYFKSLCPKHHRFVEENPLEAQKLGLSKKRLDK